MMAHTKDVVSVEAATLTATEKKRLTSLENVIERGLETFLTVGNALKEIRDGALYREVHETFEDYYCADRWDMSRPRAYQPMQAADVYTEVDIDNERQARE